MMSVRDIRMANQPLFHFDSMETNDGLRALIYSSDKPRPNGLTFDALHYMMTARAMSNQYNADQNPDWLNRAIDAWERSIPLVSDTHSEKYCWCWSVASLYVRHYAAKNDPPDLDKAIFFYQMSLRIAPQFYANRAHHLYDMGEAYMERYWASCSDITDLDNAETFFKRAIGWFLGSEPSFSWYNLGLVLARRYEFSGSFEDLDQSIAILRLAVNKCTDNMLQFDEAVSILRKLLDTMEEPELQSFRALALQSLSQALQERFLSFRDPKDQESSLIAIQQAMKEGFANKKSGPADLLSSLGMGHSTRFEHTHDPVDLDEALAVTRQAVELTPEGHWAKGSRWGDLGGLLQRRHSFFGRIDDLEEGRICCERALHDLPDDYRDKAKLLRYLGHSYTHQFHAFQQAEDLDKAVEAHLAAVEATPTDYPERVYRLWDLGRSFQERWGFSEDSKDLNQSVSAFKEAALLDRGSFFFRMRASWHWGLCAWIKEIQDALNENDQICPPSKPQCEESHQAFSRMMDLIPPAIWLGDTIAARHDLLTTTSGLIHLAADTIIHYGHLVEAAEWLEQGRSVVWRQQLNLRSHFDELWEVEPALAARMRAVSTAFDRASTDQSDHTVSQPGNFLVDEAGPPRRRLAEEWESLLIEARRVPGFERLLQPRQFAELQKAAGIGPVVMLTMGIACHALVVLEDRTDILHVPLDLPVDQMDQLRTDLSELLTNSNVRSRLYRKEVDRHRTDSQEMQRILLSLWIDVVKPVLDALGFPALGRSGLHPRIVWCPTGPFAFLPIHAAGDYSSEEPGHRISDFVVSSYTSTISTLLDVLNHHVPSELRCLTVSQSETPGLSSLPCTEMEVRKVKQRVGPAKVEELNREAATVAAVHDAMERCSWIHLACHAIQDPIDPLKSAFCLADGNLQLQDIIRKSHPHADFAFLSACQTSTGDQILVDEAVHLAAGMQLAGYRSIIATMWSIGDEDGPVVADEVYAHLFHDGHPDSSRAAHALHHAVLKLQCTTKPEDRDDSWFLRWVPFIHIGA